MHVSVLALYYDVHPSLFMKKMNTGSHILKRKDLKFEQD